MCRHPDYDQQQQQQQYDEDAEMNELAAHSTYTAYITADLVLRQSSAAEASSVHQLGGSLSAAEMRAFYTVDDEATARLDAVRYTDQHINTRLAPAAASNLLLHVYTTVASYLPS